MKQNFLKVYLVFLFLLLVFSFANCGGGGENLGNKLVDPYIVGAQLFEDLNNNGQRDSGEQLSTFTDTNGAFTFPSSLQAGSIVRINPSQKGKHNGLPYSAKIRAKVLNEGESNLVVSPLTTLLANGWTSAQVLEVLTDAGLTGVSESDLSEDPMSKFDLLATSSTLTEADLDSLRASISIYCFLRIIQEIIDKNQAYTQDTDAYGLTYTMFKQHPEQQILLTRMVSQIKRGLSKSVLDPISVEIEAAKAQCPQTVDVTIGDIIRGSVAISEFVIEEVTASCQVQVGEDFPSCDYNPLSNLSDFNEWSDALGKRFYVMRTKSNVCTQGAVSMSLLPNVLDATETCELEEPTAGNYNYNCY
jgi:hypothetical protein